MTLVFKKVTKLTLSSLTVLAFMAAPSFAQVQESEASAISAVQSPAQLEAKALMDAKNFKAAIKVLTKTQENGEDTFEISELLVESYMERIDQVGMLKKRGLAVKMRKAMEHSLELKPDSVDARENLMGFHIQAPGIVGGDKDKARELLKDFPGLTAAERNVYEARISRADKDTPGALAFLEKALQADPQNSDALISKGNIQIEQENFADAIVTFESCTQYHADNMGCHYLIGKAAHVGNIETAKGIAGLKTVVETGGSSDGLTAHAYYRLGELQARDGDVDAAKASLKRSIEINGLKDAKAALEKLQ